MSFYLSLSSNKSRIAGLIKENEGTIAGRLSKKSITLIEPDSRNLRNQTTPSYSFQFIDDSLAYKELQPLENYLISGVHSNPKRVKLKYTEAEDTALKNYVKKHQGLDSPGGNKIWQDMEQQKITTHSWQSMKAHYKNVLVAKIQKEEQNKQNESAKEQSETQKDSEDDDDGEEEEEEEDPTKPTEEDNEEESVVDIEPTPPKSHKRTRTEEPKQFHSKSPKTEKEVHLRQLIVSLAHEFHKSEHVIYHAMLIHSGNVEHAKKYLQDPTVHSDHRWTLEEDDILRGDNESKISELIQKRGKTRSHERIEFLEI